MKVFWYNKLVNERDLTLFRNSDVHDIKNIIKFNIQENLPFKYLWISNPKSSNYIYTLHNFIFETPDCNSVKIHTSDEKPIHHKMKHADNLSLLYSVENNIKSICRELTTISKSNNLLDNNYAILLPSGNLIIETEKAIKEIQITIQYSIMPI